MNKAILIKQHYDSSGTQHTSTIVYPLHYKMQERSIYKAGCQAAQLIYSMNCKCEICERRYNTTSRKPIVLICGHTLCLECATLLPEKRCSMDRQPFQTFTVNKAVFDALSKPVRPAEYERLFKICFVGESSVGKTTLLSQLTNSPATSPQITIGIDLRFVNLQHTDGRRYKIQMWDTGGQERFRSITRAHYKNAHLILVVYSLSDRRTFSEAENYWLEQVKQHAPQSKVMLIGNKLDLERRVPEISIKALCEQHQCEQAKVSSTTGLNIEPLWKRICEYLIQEMPAPQLLESTSIRNSQSRLSRSLRDSSFSRMRRCC